jgi:hypothetical protein
MRNLFLFFLMLLSTTSYNQSMNTSVLGITMPSSAITFETNTFAEPTPPKEGQIQFFENCWYVDGLIGFSGLGRNGFGGGWGGYRNVSAITLGVRVGHKWYLGGVKKWKFGVDAVGRLGMTFGFPDVSSGVTYSNFALHIAPMAGFINAIQFNDKFGLEANLNIGFNLLMSFWGAVDNNNGYRADATVIQPGLMINPNAKFRIKNFAVGLDVAVMYAAPGTYQEVYSNGGTPQTYNVGGTIFTIFSVSVGTVF